MGNFLSGGSTNADTPTVYTGIDVQTSAQGVPVALVWGHKRIAPNLIWYGDFQANPAGGKKGGKGGEGKGSGIYNYSAAVIMALGEGLGLGIPGGGAVGIGAVWQDKTITTLVALGFVEFDGQASQAPWSFLTANFPSQALTYAYTAYLANASYQLGKSPNLPNHNFEFRRTPGLWTGTLFPASNVFCGCGWNADINPALILYDFLVNPQYSIGLAPAQLDLTGLALLGQYCQAQWLTMSPDITSQEQCSQTIDRWAQLSNCWIFWSGSRIKFVPLCDTTVNPSTMGTVTDVIVSAVPLACPASSQFYFDSYPGWSADGGVVFTDTGGAATYIGSSAPTSSGEYGLSVGGSPAIASYYFYPGDAGRPIQITYSRTYSSLLSFVPNNTPIFNFTYDDFISDKGTPPLTVTRSDPADAPNHVKLEFKDRNNAYNSGIAEWKDQGLVDQFGQIDSPTTQAHEICEIDIAMRVAQLLGQRYAYIRNTYEFKLGWEYGSLLEPGDIVTLSDPHIGISAFPVRVRTLDEDDKGSWDITAEEFPGGISDCSGTQPIAGSPVNTTLNTAIPPGNVNPPAVFEPTVALTNGVPELWVAASGGPNWGGCAVFISFDNTNFSQIGLITAPAPQGLLTASLASHADPDTVDTVATNTAISNTTVNADVTTADANAFRSLALLTPAFSTTCPSAGIEVIAYGAAASTGTFTDNLTYLRRALYGTSPNAQSSGAFFSQLQINQTTPPGNTIVAYPLPKQYIGAPLFLKFCSFNKFANSLQPLSSVVTYTYTPIGTGYGAGSLGVPATPTGLTVTPGLQMVVLQWTPSPTTDNVTSYQIWAAPGASQPFGSAVQIGTSSSPNFTSAGLTGGSTSTYFIVAVNAQGSSANSTGVNGTAGSVPATPFDVSQNYNGHPPSGPGVDQIFAYTAAKAVTVHTATGSGSCVAEIAASSYCQFEIYKNGSNVGNIAFSPGGTVGVVSFGTGVTLAVGDTLSVSNFSGGDTTLANLSTTFTMT